MVHVPRVVNFRGHEIRLPVPGELARFRSTYRNWARMYAARMNLVRTPVRGVWKDGSGSVEVGNLGLAALYARGGRPTGNDAVAFEFLGRKLTLHGFGRCGDAAGVFVDEDWGWLPVAGRTVVDVGASIGDSATYFVVRGAEKVLAYELEPRTLELLRQNLALNDLTNVEARSAVANLREAADGAAGQNLVAKVDCEGCEYALLEGTSDSDLRRYSHLMFEYHHGPGALTDRLRRCGYTVRYSRPRIPSGPLGRSVGGRPGMRVGLLWAERR